MAGEVALADAAQRPIHRLAHEVSRVAGLGLDQRQPSEDGRISFLLQVNRGTGNHGEGCAPDKFTLVGGEV